jgi:glycosyltransferase involved in cell wall biosynthesis
VAYFSDAYQEANGVATVCREFESFAQRHQVPWLCVHGGSATKLHVEGAVRRLELRRSLVSFSLDRQLRCDPLLMRHRHLVADQVASFGAAIVHITSPGDVGILGGWVAHHLRLPVIASWHTNAHEYAALRLNRAFPWLTSRLRNRISAAAQRRCENALLWFYRKPQLCIAPSHQMVDFLGKRLEKPVMLIPHGVDTIRFSPEWRSRSDDTLVLGYVGRLTPEKNVRLLAAIEQELFRRGFLGFRIMVVGSGSERAWLQRNLRTADFRGTLWGSALSRAFADMDLFLFPSRTDTFGLVVLEAMASGVPAIVAPGSGPESQIRPGETGFVAETPSDYASKVIELRNSRCVHNRLRAAAREYACSTQWDQVFSRTAEVYEAVLRQPSRISSG